MDVYIVLRHGEDGAEVATIQPTEERASEAQIKFEQAALHEFSKFRLDPEVKVRWLDALRSGDYLQGTELLAKRNMAGETKYCCLGVLCDLSPFLLHPWSLNSRVLGCAGHTQDTPPIVSRWATQHEDDGTILATGKLPFFDRDGRQARLALCNDAGMPFEQLADLIEFFY